MEGVDGDCMRCLGSFFLLLEMNRGVLSSCVGGMIVDGGSRMAT